MSTPVTVGELAALTDPEHREFMATRLTEYERTLARMPWDAGQTDRAIDSLAGQGMTAAEVERARAAAAQEYAAAGRLMRPLRSMTLKDLLGPDSAERDQLEREAGRRLTLQELRRELNKVRRLAPSRWWGPSWRDQVDLHKLEHGSRETGSRATLDVLQPVRARAADQYWTEQERRLRLAVRADLDPHRWQAVHLPAKRERERFLREGPRIITHDQRAVERAAQRHTNQGETA